MPRAKKDIIGRCGYICSRCLAYRENVKSEADKKRFRFVGPYENKITLDAIRSKRRP